MSRIALNVFVVFLAVAVGIYHFYIKSFLVIIGHNRVVEPIGNGNCRKVSGFRACEDMALHQPSGLIYLACSEPQRRTQWLPGAGLMNVAGASKDTVVVYNPENSQITKLKLSGLDANVGFSAHGIDIVPSVSNPSEVFVFLVNHRPQSKHEERGADSVVEIFKHTLNSDLLQHIKTIRDPLVLTPNDLVGSEDGKSFFVTNDNGRNTGITRLIDAPLRRKTTSVVYCHIDEGCKYAIQKMAGSNGIARASNGTVYVGSSTTGRLTVLEQQNDNTLVITDIIQIDRLMDNLSIDSEGHVWAASFPKLSKIVDHVKDPSVLSPSSVFRFSMNTGLNAFYGEKYKVDKVFEDDGNIASGITTVVHDVRHKRLFLHGIAASHLTVCKI